MFIYGVINCLNRFFVDLLNDNLDFLGWDVVGCNVLFDIKLCVVFRAIIDINYVVVGIILHEN